MSDQEKVREILEQLLVKVVSHADKPMTVDIPSFAKEICHLFPHSLNNPDGYTGKE